MTRRRVKLSPGARRWFLREVSELADLNPNAASNLVDRFEAFCNNLGEFSGMGVRGKIPGTRRVVMKPYILTIRMKTGMLEILAIRHSRQSDAYAPKGVDPQPDDGI